ncbi:hypothetical protein CC80DRAFT_571967, partial [Byssothecium circinans]
TTTWPPSHSSVLKLLYNYPSHSLKRPCALFCRCSTQDSITTCQPYRTVLGPSWCHGGSLTIPRASAIKTWPACCGGGTLRIGAWTASEAFVQSSKSWRRIRRVNAYVIFIWVEWWSCFVISLICWMQMRGYFAQSFEYWFFVVFLWTMQVQCLMRIIINRVALLMPVPAHATRLKWAVFLIILLVCIGTFCTAIPAKMQISGTFLDAHNTYARVKKSVILTVDAGLNVLFIYLVRSRLITAGLDKYWKLYWFNFNMVLFSITLDALTLAVVSLPNYVVYLQFHPLAYLIKLHIELKMADLIGKIVNSSQPIKRTESY